MFLRRGPAAARRGYGRRSPAAALLVGLAASSIAASLLLVPKPNFCGSAAALRGVQAARGHDRCLAAAAAAAEVVDVDPETDGSAALARLEDSLAVKIEEAKVANDEDRMKSLGRLLVLAKAAEGIALRETAGDVSKMVRTSFVESMNDFMGKEDYDVDEVVDEVSDRFNKAVKSLDDIYLEDIAGGVESIMTRVGGEFKDSAEVAVTSFTGKEDYEFGDITKEADKRAKEAVAIFTGKEEYQFGDISKEVASRAADAVKDFTGKEEYKFGDITKTVLGKVFGGDDKEKK